MVSKKTNYILRKSLTNRYLLETDPTGKSFILKVSKKNITEQRHFSFDDEEYKVYHLQAKTEKQQMSWTNHIKKVVEKQYKSRRSVGHH